MLPSPVGCSDRVSMLISGLNFTDWCSCGPECDCLLLTILLFSGFVSSFFCSFLQVSYHYRTSSFLDFFYHFWSFLSCLLISIRYILNPCFNFFSLFIMFIQTWATDSLLWAKHILITTPHTDVSILDLSSIILFEYLYILFTFVSDFWSTRRSCIN